MEARLSYRGVCTKLAHVEWATGPYVDSQFRRCLAGALLHIFHFPFQEIPPEHYGVHLTRRPVFLRSGYLQSHTIHEPFDLFDGDLRRQAVIRSLLVHLKLSTCFLCASFEFLTAWLNSHKRLKRLAHPTGDGQNSSKLLKCLAPSCLYVTQCEGVRSGMQVVC